MTVGRSGFFKQFKLYRPSLPLGVRLCELQGLNDSEDSFAHTICKKDLAWENGKKKSVYCQPEWYVLSTYQYIPSLSHDFMNQNHVPGPGSRYRGLLLTSSMYFKTYISYQYVHIKYVLGTYLARGVKSMPCRWQCQSR